MSISTKQLQIYKRTAQRRWQLMQQQQLARREQALALARQAALLLKEQYHAERVVLFGSLTHSRRFTQWSDVDLAVWGLTSGNWLQASAAVRNLSDEIDVQLVDIDCASPELLAAIEQEGIPL